MGRLIDDIKLKASITANEILETNKPLEDIIDNQPTAYDVEAVLNELDNMRAKPTELVYDVPFIDHIIEVVRKGGLSNE